MTWVRGEGRRYRELLERQRKEGGAEAMRKVGGGDCGGRQDGERGGR